MRTTLAGCRRRLLLRRHPRPCQARRTGRSCHSRTWLRLWSSCRHRRHAPRRPNRAGRADSTGLPGITLGAALPAGCAARARLSVLSTVVVGAALATVATRGSRGALSSRPAKLPREEVPGARRAGSAVEAFPAGGPVCPVAPVRSFAGANGDAHEGELGALVARMPYTLAPVDAVASPTTVSNCSTTFVASAAVTPVYGLSDLCGQRTRFQVFGSYPP